MEPKEAPHTGPVLHTTFLPAIAPETLNTLLTLVRGLEVPCLSSPKTLPDVLELRIFHTEGEQDVLRGPQGRI